MSQTDAASGAAASQHLAAIASGHALTEAVLLGTLTLLGLIGTKHGGHLLIQVKTGFPGPTTAELAAAVNMVLNPAGRNNPLPGNSATYYRTRNSNMSTLFFEYFQKNLYFFAAVLDIVYANYFTHNFPLPFPCFLGHSHPASRCPRLSTSMCGQVTHL